MADRVTSMFHLEGATIQERSEYLASLVLQCSLPNRRIEWLKDQKELDLRILFNDDVIGFAEVTLDRDGNRALFEAKLSKLGNEHQLPISLGAWTMVVNDNFNAKNPIGSTVDLVNRMHNLGQTDSDWLFGPELIELRREIKISGITSLRKIEHVTDFDKLYIFQPFESGVLVINSEVIDNWISALVVSNAFKKKINQINGSTNKEKHLVLFMDSATPWEIRFDFKDERRLKLDSPVRPIPEEVQLDYLWIIHPSLSRWWVWSKPDSRWLIYDLTEEFSPSASYFPVLAVSK